MTMKNDMIFFSKDGQGLTSTSADHVANLAKEMIRGLETALSNMAFYSVSVSLIVSETSELMSKGRDSEELADVPRKLTAIAKAKSLIAWLREAIKAKERMLKEVSDMTDEDYMELKGIKPVEYVAPAPALTEDEYYASLTLDERNRYYELETFAAVLGKAIHPEGSFATARERMLATILNPRKAVGQGRDTVIYAYEPSLDEKEVDDLYFKLQKQYREAQAGLNAIKFGCQKAVKESELEYASEVALRRKRFMDEQQRIADEAAVYRKERARAIGNYKIVIPQSLSGIYDEVTQLGKK